MNLNFVYKFTGYLSIVVGAAAAACTYRPQLMVLAIGFSLLGFLISGINVFLNMKYFSESDTFPKGYMGIFLSSLPVLFMLYMIFQSRR
ncbi:MAG: hypothetical protein V4635_07195 [Bacteroidota bacterium]